MQVMECVGALSVSMKCHISGKGHRLEIKLDEPQLKLATQAGHPLLVPVRSSPFNLPSLSVSYPDVYTALQHIATLVMSTTSLEVAQEDPVCFAFSFE